MDTTTTVISGTSDKGSLEEAIQDAIAHMNAFAGQSGNDMLVCGTLTSVTVESGGFAPVRTLTVQFDAHLK